MPATGAALHFDRDSCLSEPAEVALDSAWADTEVASQYRCGHRARSSHAHGLDHGVSSLDQRDDLVGLHRRVGVGLRHGVSLSHDAQGSRHTVTVFPP
jgi:hypothetical protein